MIRVCHVVIVAAGMLSSVSLSALGEQLSSSGGSAEISEAIPSLGDFDYSVRAEASRVLRRTDAASVVPALIMAAQSHGDSYVQFRAAVLLAGFGGNNRCCIRTP